MNMFLDSEALQWVEHAHDSLELSTLLQEELRTHLKGMEGWVITANYRIMYQALHITQSHSLLNCWLSVVAKIKSIVLIEDSLGISYCFQAKKEFKGSISNMLEECCI